MRNLPIEINGTTTSGADKNQDSQTFQRLLLCGDGRRIPFPAKEQISPEVRDLINTATPHESIVLETSPKSEQPKSRSSIGGAAMGKFLKTFSCFRLGSGQQNEKDSKDLPNIFAGGEGNPFFSVFDDRSADHFSNKVTAELVHQEKSNKTEDVEMSNSPPMIVSGIYQVSRLDKRREKILTNVI
jgi:hypothetical protein